MHIQDWKENIRTKNTNMLKRGFKEGDKFKPHKTHQNGLSVDLMTPVLDSSNKSMYLPTHAFNKFGSILNFPTKGGLKSLG